jgi:RNA polymerase sigma factor (sigma-70 family)
MLKILSDKREEELVRGCQKNDRLTQKKVYEKYSSKMFVICKRYLKEEYEAEDALANGFFKVFSKIDQYKNEGSFEGWVRRIIVNECLNQLRKNKSMYIVNSLENAKEQEEYHNADTILDAEELLQLIAKLPDGYRTVFNLYAIEGYNHQEIADLLQISEGTSKSQLSRARSLLQKYISDNEAFIKNIYNG